MDAQKRILIDFYLKSENFSVYKYNSTNKSINIGLNPCHLYRMLKNIKKKDAIILFIDKNKESDLGIQVIPKENNRVITSYIKIQNIQNLEIDLPSGYDKPIVVPSTEYQKLCKDLNNIGNTISITSTKSLIKFLCDAGNVYSREIIFGTIENNDKDALVLYSGTFDTEKLLKITKLSGLSNNIKIYTKNDLPVLFKSNIGHLGEISIYIKSKEQVENELSNELENNK